MAEQGRRAVVGDPLELNPNAQMPDRSLQLGTVRNPQQTAGDADYRNVQGVLGAVTKLQGVVGELFDQQKDEWVNDGKMQYMQGVTEEAIKANGNMYTQRGWQSLNIADKANQWFLTEQQELTNGAFEKNPDEYRRQMQERRAQFLGTVGNDPALRKVAVAAFDDLAPRLTTAHAQKHNEYNKEQTKNNFKSTLISGGAANADASVSPSSRTGVDSKSPLALSSGTVRVMPAVAHTEKDIDILTRTAIGEAYGEGATGVAAVVHNIINRATDGANRWPKTLSEVALQPNQYSAWNKGAGGNKGVNASPDSPAYQAVRAIVTDVLTGRHADPTNGATHYYSPNGMKALVAGGSQSNLIPRWLQAERNKSGGEIVIGGHIFVGRAAGQAVTQSEVGVQAAAAEAQTAGVSPAILNKWKNSSEEELANVAMSNDSTPALRKEAEAVMQARRAVKAPDGTPGAPRQQAEVSVASGANPVQAAAAQGVVTRETPSRPTPQVQAFFRDYPGMKAKDKANTAAEAIVEQLAQGNDQLFRDLGGVGVLQQYGADSARVTQVLTAHKQFLAKRDESFDAARIQADEARVNKVKNGEWTQAEALADLDYQVKNNMMSDSRARSQYAAITAEYEKRGQKDNLDPNLTMEIIGIKNRFTDGAIDIYQADSEIKSLREKYKIPDAQLEKTLGTLQQIEESRATAHRTALAAAEKKRVEQDQRKAAVGNLVGNGRGLGGASHIGEIEITDGAGRTRKVSAAQYGVLQIKQEENAAAMKTLPDYVKSGQYTESEAQAKVSADSETRQWRRFNKHDVVDEDLSSAVTAGLTGNIINQKGEVDQSSQLAFDTYLRMRNDSGVGAEYASRYFKNEQSRSLAYTAAELFDGGADIKTALRRANEIQQRKNTGTQDGAVSAARGDINSDTVRSKLTENIGKKMGEIANDGVIMPGLPYSARQIHESSMAGLSTLAQRRLAEYNVMEPQNSSGVNEQKASEDIVKGTIIVGGNAVYGDPRPGAKKRLDQVMGLEQFGRDAPHHAIDAEVRAEMYRSANNLKKSGVDPLGWGKAMIDRNLPSSDMGTNITPQYHMRYDPTTGIAYIKPWKDENRTETVGKELAINLRALGQKYKDGKIGRAGDAPGIMTSFSKFFGGAVGGAKSGPNARAAGTRMGELLSEGGE